jgi:HCOMODA/2-hydroxy-3-carboxy-muconic semialdehyde decarboxylase
MNDLADLPNHLSNADVDVVMLDELVLANHILYRQGVVDGFGHVSQRHPRRPHQFLMSRSLAPARVMRADITLLDEHGEPVPDQPGIPYLERFIHSAIYSLRPDVSAIVHSHSPNIVPFSAVPSTGLRPIFHMCGFLGTGAPVFEIREAAGRASDLLVRDGKLGHALACCLGSASVVLMRGHGSTTIGSGLRQAVYRAIYAEVNARLQMAALQLGQPDYLTPEEAASAAQSNDKQVDRTWDLWRDEVARSA